MDDRALSDAEPLRSSVALERFRSSLYGPPGSWRGIFRDMQGRHSAFAERAADPAWRKKFKRHALRGESAYHDFVDAEITERGHRTRMDTERAFAERNFGVDPPASSTWFLFERLAAAAKRGHEARPRLGLYLDFLVAHESRPMDFEEAIMWMLCAYLNLSGLDDHTPAPNGVRAGADDLVPLKVWIPTAHGLRELSTSRYRVIDHLIGTCGARGDDRNLRHLRGGPRLAGPDSHRSVRSLNPRHAVVLLLAALEDASGSRAPPDAARLGGLLAFAGFFEWVQLSMLRRHVRAWRIQASFERLPEVRHALQIGFDEYVERHGSRGS